VSERERDNVEVESNPFQWLLSIIYQGEGEKKGFGLKIIGCYFLHGSAIAFDAKRKIDNTS
jgi:hypothetical protein